MSLRTKIFLILLVLAGAFSVGQGVVVRTLVFPKFAQLEEQGARRDMDRIQYSIASALKSLDILCHDWASWDDAADFVEGRSPDFDKINIPDNFFEAAFIDYLHFIDRHGRTKYRKAINPVTKNDFTVEGFAAAGASGQPGLQEDTAPLVKSGLIFVGEVSEPLLLVSRPILGSDGSGQAHGTLVMGRFLDRDSLQQNVGVDLVFRPVRAVAPDGDDRQALSRLQSGEQAPVIRYEQDSIHFYSLHNSIYGAPLFLIVAQKPAEIRQYGDVVTRTAIWCYLLVVIVFLLTVFFLLGRIVTTPIDVLCRQTRELVKTADFSRRIELADQSEIAELGQCVNELLQRVVGNENLLAAANNKLLEQSLTDPLTGLANRRDFDAYMEHEWARLHRDKSPLSVLMCDVDYFKKYNDTYGHVMGDHCLQELAKVLSDVAKRPADLPVRYGGEEFVVVLPDTDRVGASHVAQSMRDAVQGLKIEHVVSDLCPWLTMSVGVATLVPCDRYNSDDLVCMADEALYKAKKQGRNQVVVFGE